MYSANHTCKKETHTRLLVSVHMGIFPINIQFFSAKVISKVCVRRYFLQVLLLNILSNAYSQSSYKVIVLPLQWTQSPWNSVE